MAKSFDHGQIVMTRAISDRMQDNKFAGFVYNSLVRHLKCDWGNLSKEDWETNEIALKNGEQTDVRNGRILRKPISFTDHCRN